MNRPTFADAARSFVNLCDMIDNATEIDEAMQNEFNDTLRDVQKAVDRRKAFSRFIESQIEAAKDHKAHIEREIKRCESLKESFLANTKAIISAHPEVVFQGTDGKALKVLRNATPRLVLLEPEDQIMKQHPQYAKTKTTVDLDRERLKKDLLEGSLPFGRLEWGSHVKGLL